MLIIYISLCVVAIVLICIFCYNNMHTWEQNHQDALDIQTHHHATQL